MDEASPPFRNQISLLSVQHSSTVQFRHARLCPKRQGLCHRGVPLGLMTSGADPTIRNLEGFSPFFVASVVKQDLGLTAILMKTNDNSSRAKPFPLADFGSEPPVARRFTDTASLIQWSARFGYKFI